MKYSINCMKLNWLVLLLVVAAEVPLYSQQLEITYLGEIIKFTRPKAKLEVKAKEEQVKKIYWQLKQGPDYASLVGELQQVKQSKELADWFYYSLVKQVAESLADKNDERNFLIWYLMGESGYTSRLAVQNRQLEVYVGCQQLVPGMIRAKGKYCFSCKYDGGQIRMRMLELDPYRRGELFSFEVNSIPENRGEIFERQYSFYSKPHGKRIILKVEVNKTIVDGYNKYPNLAFNTIFSVPLSDNAMRTFVEPLKIAIDSLALSPYEASGFLLEVVRQTIDYSYNESGFNREKWLTPEEVLFYGEADCEGKSALFYYLVDQILEIPQIIIEYPEKQHVNIGIAVAGSGKEEVIIKEGDTVYMICEPTIEYSFTMPVGGGDIAFHTWKHILYKE